MQPMQRESILGSTRAQTSGLPQHVIVALVALIGIGALFFIGALISLVVIGMNVVSASDPGLSLGCADHIQQSCQQLQVHQTHLAMGFVGVLVCGTLTITCAVVATSVAVIWRVRYMRRSRQAPTAGHAV